MHRFMLSFLITSLIWVPLSASQPTKKQKIAPELSAEQKTIAFLFLRKKIAEDIAKKPADDKLLTLYHCVNIEKTKSYSAIISFFKKHLGVMPDHYLLAALHTTIVTCMHTHLAKKYGEDFDKKKSASWCSWLTDLFIGKQSE